MSGCGCRHGVPLRVVGGLVVVAVLAGASGVRQAAAGIRAAVEVAAITGLSLGGLALLAAVTFGVYRLRQAASRPAPYRVEVVDVTPARGPQDAPRAPRAALEPSRPIPLARPLAARQGAGAILPGGDD